MDRPSVLDVLIAPLKWIEKARGWRRIGLIVAYLLVGSTVGLLVWRELSLWRIPSIGEPFDLEKHGTIVVADLDNAMVGYSQAVRLIKPRNYDTLEVNSKLWFVFDWPTADPAVRAWYQENRRALDAFLVASERPNALLVQPRAMEIDTTFQTLQAVRDLSGLAAMESSRLIAAGDLEGAWPVIRAMLRASRHAGMHGGVVQRLVGDSLLIKARSAASSWTEDSRVTPAMLKQAIDDLGVCVAMTSPPSEMIYAEYFVMKSSLENPAIWRKAGLEQDPDDASNWYEQYPSYHLANRFLRNEPRRSLRLLRLVIADRLAQCDRPPSDRPPARTKYYGIYDHDERTPPAVLTLTPIELEAQIRDSVLMRILPALSQTQGRIDQDRGKLDTLRLAMAERAYQLEQGRPAKTYGELLKTYLKVLPDGIKPGDPTNAATP